MRPAIFLAASAVAFAVPPMLSAQTSVTGAPGRTSVQARHPGRAAPGGSLRASFSTSDGYSAAMDFLSGAARIAAVLSAEPGARPEIRLGASGPLGVAGPCRNIGLARFLEDPGADSYLFEDAWPKPLAMDLDSGWYGACVGRAAGIWVLDAKAPRLGIWAGTGEGYGILAGAAAAASILPADPDFDTWFSEDPVLPARVLASGSAWLGYCFETGRVLAAAARSEEDRGVSGWAVRVEGQLRGRRVRWGWRASAVSTGWKGLGGRDADPWELRADASWAPMPRLRLEGRFRAWAAQYDAPTGGVGWEAQGRAGRSGSVWDWGAELEASNTPGDPH
ncbi:MAG TPA: hypothetical protein VLH39_01165, partial [Magnetospirillaceae bacterium]|nr:hypothetical protein [Magnetospirillaceae bacterium]